MLVVGCNNVRHEDAGGAFGTVRSGKHKRVDPFAAGPLSCYATAISLKSKCALEDAAFEL